MFVLNSRSESSFGIFSISRILVYNRPFGILGHHFLNYICELQPSLYTTSLEGLIWGSISKFLSIIFPPDFTVGMVARNAFKESLFKCVWFPRPTKSTIRQWHKTHSELFGKQVGDFPRGNETRRAFFNSAGFVSVSLPWLAVPCPHRKHTTSLRQPATRKKFMPS